MELYVIRHGQVDTNVKNIMNTYTDIELNSTGIMQANNILDDIKNIDYDVIISSPLKRTSQTANIINYKGIEVIYDDRIVERNAGMLEGKKSNSIDLDNYWNYYNNHNDYKAETISMLFERIEDFLNDIKKKYSNKTVIVVTHNGVCRAFGCYFNGVPKNGNMRVYSQNNCEIRKYNFT